jgi:hypothetical protein
MTTTEFRSINFLNQTGNFDYNINLTSNNSTGYFEFGLSGNKNLTFKGQYGKIKDINDNIIIGYVPDQELNIKGSIYSGKESLTIEDNLIYSNISNTGYNFNYFYLNPINCSLDYNFSLTGAYTDFSSKVTTPKIKDFNILVDSEDTPFTTRILTGILINENPNLEIKIFSGIATSKSNSYSLHGFPIAFNNSGTYLITTSTGSDSLVNDTFDALFYTNFGNISKTITISGEVIPLFFLFFDVFPPISGFPNVQTGYSQIFVNNLKNYSLSYGFVSGANVQLSLSYISGLTGDVTGFLSATGKFDGILSGYLTGSGNISSYVATGITFSGGNEFLNNVQFVTDSGFYAQQFKVATGYSQGNYVITGYGLGSGYVYESVFATGKVRVLVTGNVPYVGGTAVAVNPYPFTGSGIAYNQNNSGFIATGIVDGYYPNLALLVYTGELTGITLNNTQYSGKTFSYSPPKDYVSVSSKPYKISATGYESGIGNTGTVNGDFFMNLDQGYYTFVKNFTGIKGESRSVDDEEIITGYLGILNCDVSESRNYISYADGLSGVVSGSAYLSLCDADSALPSGFIANATTTNPTTLYVITGECGEPGQILDQTLPKFVVIKPTGEYELNSKLLETGYNFPINQEQYYITTQTGIRTHIFGAGSGYFSNIVGNCKNSGRWEHFFYASQILVEQNISDYIVNNINFDLVTLEDDGRDYFSEVNFEVTGALEKFNLTLNNKNIPINAYPARDIYYNLILSRKVNDGYSGLYENYYVNINSGVQFCTGLIQGDYKARVKYVNVSNGPTGKNICRVPIQIVNILDKNYYNQNNIDLFTGYLVYDFDTYRFRGTGWHHQANMYYTRSEIYSTQFLTNTGWTTNHRLNLYKASEKSQLPFTYDNTIVKAIQYAVTGGITGWQSKAVKSINLITNNISLSGWDRNDFLNYIKSVNNNEQIIFNTLNCPNSNSLDDNFKSFDSSSEFLKDIATAGGGTYYNCDNYFSTIDNYGGYAGLVPLTSQALYTTCDGYYPANSQPPIRSETVSTDSRSGYLGITLPPAQFIPVDPPVVIPPIPAIELPPIIPYIEPPGPVEDAPEQANPPLDPPQEPISDVGNPFVFPGGGGSPSGPGPSPRPKPPTKCDKRNEKITFTITSREWKTSPTSNGKPCKCQKEGVYVVKGTVSNPNCIGKNVKINGTIRITDKSGNILKKYEGSTSVGVNGTNGEEIPKETPSPFDKNNPTPSQVPSISESNIVGKPNVQGLNNGPDFKPEVKGLDQYKMDGPNVQGLKTNAPTPSVQGLKTDAPAPSVQGLNSNPAVGKPSVQGLSTNTMSPSVPGLK